MSKLPESEMKGERRIALVTGASGAMGRAIAVELARLGHIVAVSDVEPSGLRLTAAEVSVAGASVLVVEGDVTKSDSVEQMVAQVVSEFGGLDVLVNCAGVISVGLVKDLSEAEWDWVIAVNLKGVFLCTKAALPHLLLSPSGRIVSISSDAGKTGEPYLAHYSASKFGIVGFSQSLALELAQTPVTANVVCPVICDTEMASRLAENYARVTGTGNADTWRSRFIAEVPVGRMASPADVAGAVAYLVSPQASFITGQAINVSGAHEVH
jgi:meso-butanediol dehydrogenase/(S,S)-butanediol dehydrogenase/diacetyl reductase